MKLQENNSTNIFSKIRHGTRKNVRIVTKMMTMIKQIIMITITIIIAMMINIGLVILIQNPNNINNEALIMKRMMVK